MTNNPNPVCLLSGGIDSTVVAATAKRVTPLQAITLGSIVPGTMDERFARTAAMRLGIDLQVVHPRSSRLANDICWALDLQDEPLGILSFFPLAILVREAKNIGKVLLTGDGGDEVFCGYGSPADWVVEGKAHDAPPPAGVLDPAGAPQWMTGWARDAISRVLVGHMHAKLDRATAEQGVEARCPLLDWDLVRYARRLPPQILFAGDRPKALLKELLHGWPDSLVLRKKMGFPFRLRWLWALSAYSGLRELVDRDAVYTFEPWLPPALRKHPGKWSSIAITQHFLPVWKLLAWSRFCRRFDEAVAP